MPAAAVKPGQEKHWERAKRIIADQYPEAAREKGDKFYALVMTVFKNIAAAHESVDVPMGLILERLESRRRRVDRSEGREDAGNYQLSTSHKTCGNCRHFTKGNWCALFEFKAQANFVCDSWRANPVGPMDQGDKSKNTALASM